MNAQIKNTFKALANTCCTLLILPLFIVYRVLAVLDNKDQSFWSASQFLSLFPGLLGNYLRKSFYRLAMTRCDKDCAIMFGTIFSQADTEIGQGVYIGPQCNIGKCKIGKFCTIGSGVHILSGKQQHYFDDLERPIREQSGVFEKIVISEDTWIGNGAIVMANIGKKCIIGAGSVVTKDVEDFSIMAGNPARVIQKRK